MMIFGARHTHEAVPQQRTGNSCHDTEDGVQPNGGSDMGLAESWLCELIAHPQPVVATAYGNPKGPSTSVVSR